MICEPDQPKDDDDMTIEEPPVGHHGCNHEQPLIRKEGLKLFQVYKKGKADDDEVSGSSTCGESVEVKLTHALIAGSELQDFAA